MSSDFEHNQQQGKAVMIKRGEVIIEIYRLPDKELEMVRQRKNGMYRSYCF